MTQGESIRKDPPTGGNPLEKIANQEPSKFPSKVLMVHIVEQHRKGLPR